MNPTTQAMLQILRHMRQNGSATEWLINPDVRAELEEQELIERDPDTTKPGWRRPYILTPAGRRVLAEHDRRGDVKPPKLYTTVEAAEILRLDTSSVRRLARKFKVGQRLGRDWFFSQVDLDRMKARPSPGNPSFVQQPK